MGLIAGLHVTSRRPCWWSRTKAFHVNFSSKISIVLTPNMGALSRGCKQRLIFELDYRSITEKAPLLHVYK